MASTVVTFKAGDFLMATQYQRGTKKENQAREELERVGYSTARSAGSKGLFDVFAFMPPNKIRAIQVKRDKDEADVRRECEYAMEELREKGYTSRGPVTFEVWGWLDYQQEWLIQEVVT